MTVGLVQQRGRKVGSMKRELLEKSREAALAAVQIFNNPQIKFKSELFTVTICIAWTYLMHAYYRSKGLEYRYFRSEGKRRRFDRTKSGAYKHWELERCVNEKLCPLDVDTRNNLRFLIGLRHEIEHQMTTRIDDSLTAKFQACCLNYNEYLKRLFGVKYAIDKHLAVSIQFAHINAEQVDALESMDNLPAHIKTFIGGFETNLSEPEFNSPKYAYRVLFVQKTANRKGQADKVVDFHKADSVVGAKVNDIYFKETERQKYLPSQIVMIMKQEGHAWFSQHCHTKLWQEMDAKDPSKGFGAIVAGGHWYWYESWIAVVRDYCKNGCAHNSPPRGK